MQLNKFFERITHNWPIKILSITAAVLLFLFNQMATLEERFLSVPLEIRTSEQYIPAENYPRTVRVTMRGQSEDINLVLEDDVQVYADFTEYSREGRYTVPIRVVKEGRLSHIDPLELHVEPKKISLKIEKKLAKSVEVKPRLVGYAAKGYELTQYFLTPSSVEVEGVESTVEDLESIETEPIDLSGRNEDFTVRLRLKKPDQFTVFPGGDTVEFFGIVQEKTILKTVEDIDLIALDLAGDLAVSGVPEDTRMTVQGSQLQLEQVNNEDFMLTFDCSDIEEPGAYTLSVTPDVPRGVLVMKYSPTSVEIKVSELEEPE